MLDNETKLHEGGELFEKFWLQPEKYKGQSVLMRLKINRKWSGWKIKDELVNLLKLKIGNTISTEVTPFFTSGIIDDDGDTDLFASEEGADWLIENNVSVGTIIDCRVRFSFLKAPVGLNGKEINQISLIFEEGIGIYERNLIDEENEKSKDDDDGIDEILKKLFQS